MNYYEPARNNASIPYRATSKSLTLYLDGDVKLFDNSHPSFAAIINALNATDYAEVRTLCGLADMTPQQVEALTVRTLLEASGYFVIDEANNVFLNVGGEAIHGSILARIVDTLKLGLDISPLLNFLTRLEANPSFRSREQLYGFLDVCDHPILPDGRFLAYKSVNSNRYDAHTGNTFLNADGAVIEMPRTQVDDDPNRTCSAGLHVCSRGYGRFSSLMLEVAVAPEDVVSVPTDYNNAKMRVCKYQVLREVPDYSFWGGKPLYEGQYDADDGDRYEADEDEGDVAAEALEYAILSYLQRKQATRTLSDVVDELSDILRYSLNRAVD